MCLARRQGAPRDGTGVNYRYLHPAGLPTAHVSGGGAGGASKCRLCYRGILQDLNERGVYLLTTWIDRCFGHRVQSKHVSVWIWTRKTGTRA